MEKKILLDEEEYNHLKDCEKALITKLTKETKLTFHTRDNGIMCKFFILEDNYELMFIELEKEIDKLPKRFRNRLNIWIKK